MGVSGREKWDLGIGDSAFPFKTSFCLFLGVYQLHLVLLNFFFYQIPGYILPLPFWYVFVFCSLFLDLKTSTLVIFLLYQEGKFSILVPKAVDLNPGCFLPAEDVIFGYYNRVVAIGI